VGRVAASDRAGVAGWEHVIPFMAFSPEVRRVIYTTNANRGPQPAATQGDQDEGALPDRGRGAQARLLAIQNAVPQWTRTRGWTKALLAFKDSLRRPTTD
jgi:transposase-like protein